MKTLATTKMSTKGQVVIPEDIRKRLKIGAGSRFVVVGQDDMIILKAIEPPSLNEFNGLIKKVRQEAKKAGIKRTDISEAISQVRRRGK
jgi:AbrB family looped-hinge helix DNA binding protein